MLDLALASPVVSGPAMIGKDKVILPVVTRTTAVEAVTDPTSGLVDTGAAAMAGTSETIMAAGTVAATTAVAATVAD